MADKCPEVLVGFDFEDMGTLRFWRGEISKPLWSCDVLAPLEKTNV